jgi:hypothetical protein
MLRTGKSTEEVPVKVIKDIHQVLTKYAGKTSTHNNNLHSWPSSPGFSPVMPGRNLAFMQVVHFVVSGHPVLPNADYIIFKDQR